jgi:hypothetical protein
MKVKGSSIVPMRSVASWLKRPRRYEGRFSLRGDKYRKANRFADAHARPTWNHAILVAALQVKSLSIFARQLQDAPSFPELVSGKLYSKPAMNCILQNESFHEDSTPDAPKNTNPKTRV